MDVSRLISNAYASIQGITTVASLLTLFTGIASIRHIPWLRAQKRKWVKPTLISVAGILWVIVIVVYTFRTDHAKEITNTNPDTSRQKPSIQPVPHRDSVIQNTIIYIAQASSTKTVEKTANQQTPSSNGLQLITTINGKQNDDFLGRLKACYSDQPDSIVSLSGKKIIADLTVSEKQAGESATSAKYTYTLTVTARQNDHSCAQQVFEKTLDLFEGDQQSTLTRQAFTALLTKLKESPIKPICR
jgi:hypothetical protein